MKNKNAKATEKEQPTRRETDYTGIVIDRRYCDTLADSVFTVTGKNGESSCMSSHLCGGGECVSKPHTLG